MKWIVGAAVGAAALVVVGAVCSWPFDTADEWGALAAWVTAGVAVAAGLIALSQLGEARRLRVEQAQPYVVAFMEPSPAAAYILDLVVRNFGTTAAHDVRLEIEPAPRSAAAKEGDEIWLPESIPVLVPGQEWRTLWDTGRARHEIQLPNRHEAVVSFKDSRGKPAGPLHSVLDWGAYMNRSTVEVYGPHHAAKALRDISNTVAKWRSPG